MVVDSHTLYRRAEESWLVLDRNKKVIKCDFIICHIDDCLKSRIPARRISSWNVDKNTERSRTAQLVRHKIGPASQSGFAAKRLIIDTAMVAGSNSESPPRPGLSAIFCGFFPEVSTSGRELITDRGKKVAKMRFRHLSYR